MSHKKHRKHLVIELNLVFFFNFLLFFYIKVYFSLLFFFCMDSKAIYLHNNMMILWKVTDVIFRNSFKKKISHKMARFRQINYFFFTFPLSLCLHLYRIFFSLHFKILFIVSFFCNKYGCVCFFCSSGFQVNNDQFTSNTTTWKTKINKLGLNTT